MPCTSTPPQPRQALPSIALLHLVEAAAASLRATVSPHGPYGGTAHGRGPYGRAGGVWPRVPRYVDPGAPLQVGGRSDGCHCSVGESSCMSAELETPAWGAW